MNTLDITVSSLPVEENITPLLGDEAETHGSLFPALILDKKLYEKKRLSLISSLQQLPEFSRLSPDLFDHQFFSLFLPVCIHDLYIRLEKFVSGGLVRDIDSALVEYIHMFFTQKIDGKKFSRYLLSHTFDDWKDCKTLSDFEKRLMSIPALLPDVS